MAVTKTWSITDLTRETSDGYVCWVKWKLTGTEGDKTVESKGLTKLERPSSALEPYDSLTEEKVIGWVKAKSTLNHLLLSIKNQARQPLKGWKQLWIKRWDGLTHQLRQMGNHSD